MQNRNLITEIQILKDNPDYRVSDIVIKSGFRWRHSGNSVLQKDKYKDTILRKYLEINGLEGAKNLNVLGRVISDHVQKYQVPLPNDDELVIHIRVGDVIQGGILKHNYIL